MRYITILIVLIALILYANAINNQTQNRNISDFESSAQGLKF
jgi:hypothetical protein